MHQKRHFQNLESADIFWSGKRGSNPRHPAWEAGALPLSYSRIIGHYTLWILNLPEVLTEVFILGYY